MRSAVSTGLAALFVLAPLVISGGNHDAANLPQSAFLQVSVLSLLLGWLAAGLAKGSYALPRTPAGAPLAALLAWAGLSLVWAENRYEGAVVWIHWATSGLVLVMVADVGRDRRVARRLLAGIVAGGAAVALLGAAQHLFGVTWVPQAFPPAATFMNKNVAAQYLVLALPLGLALGATAGRAAIAGLPLLASAVMGAFVYYTFTRSAWVAAAAQLGLVAFWLRRRGLPRYRIPVLAAASAFVVLVHLGPSGPESALSRIHRTLLAPWRSAPAGAGPAASPQPALEPAIPAAGPGDAETPPSTSGATAKARQEEAPEPRPGEDPAPAVVVSVEARMAIWSNTLAMIRDFPLAGVGLGNHPIHYPAYARRVVADPLAAAGLQLENPHNEYLQAAAELGLVGVALAAWLALAIAATVRRAARETAGTDASWQVMGCAALLLGLAVDAVFSFPFHRALPPTVAMAALGLIVAACAAAVREVPAPPLAGRGALLAAGAALVALAWFETRSLRADRHLLRAYRANASRDWPALLAESQAARLLNPHRPEPAFFEGRAWLALGDARRAAAGFAQAVAHRPFDLTALANLGLASAEARDFRQALESTRRASALKPDDARLHFRTAELMAAQGEGRAALEHYAWAARLEPDSRLYCFRWGIWALQERAYAEAELALGRALALDPRSALTHKAMGVLLLEGLGRKKEGIEHFRRALALEPGSKDAEQMRRAIAAYEREEGGRRLSGSDPGRSSPHDSTRMP